MKRTLVVVLVMTCLAPIAAAQTGGFAFIAPGQTRAFGQGETTLHFGGGGKYITKSGLGFGAELGLIGFTQAYSETDMGLFSLNGYYFFPVGSEKFKPFATGGYSRSFGHSSGANIGNFGVGFDYWFKPRMGFMTEFRDHIHRTSGITFQILEFRFGLTFK